MDRKHIVITGGSGFVGTELAKRAIAQGFRVTILDILPPRITSPLIIFIKVDLLKESVPESISDAHAIVHLMGASIFNRWTKAYKKLIYDTRIETAKKLFEFFKEKPTKPSALISASAIGFYGSRGDELLDEDKESGTDFLAGVCRDWEGVADLFKTFGARVVTIRTGIVLSHGGGMLAKLIPIFKMCLGGPMGNGKQWFSFISMTDLVRIYEASILDQRYVGPINAVAPVPVQNHELAKALGRMLKKPAFIPVPAFALRIILGEFADAVLSSQRVVPTKLAELHFTYSAENIDEALR